MFKQEERITELSREERQKLAEKALKAITIEHRKTTKRQRKGRSLRKS
jgi:hypothetical protein